jgi:8-oxo-dGTP pyrophosphatase MutT (NUDIX family)
MRRTSQPFRTDRPARAELAAGVAVFDPERQELLLLHLTEEDRWCFPKGHVETDETVEEAALREFEEETGLSGVKLGEELGLVTYRFYAPKKDKSVVKSVVYFFARSPVRPVRPEPLFDDGRWVSLEIARELVEFDADRDVIDLVARHLARVAPSTPGSGKG